MKLLLSLALIVFSFTTQAENLELTANPWAGYSDANGVSMSLEAALNYRLDQNWQVGAGFGFVGYAKTAPSDLRVFLGPTYNFSADITRAFFLGFGIGYDDHFPTAMDHPSTYGYVEFGKRFLLSDDYQITWAPHVQLVAGRDGGNFDILPAQFSIFF